ncbi:hypothetical protein DPEC_G00223940 [Dallia pectoralis]|uniref:Uncharacterized protein n=1 Tax=Dallia pectoralis TaxID=75939 RepID=A0ACC2G0C7_DALPE|nr:hypothetical protein DPEC_G00223940 [Dallia pectoralis]
MRRPTGHKDIRNHWCSYLGVDLQDSLQEKLGEFLPRVLDCSTEMVVLKDPPTVRSKVPHDLCSRLAAVMESITNTSGVAVNWTTGALPVCPDITGDGPQHSFPNRHITFFFLKLPVISLVEDDLTLRRLISLLRNKAAPGAPVRLAATQQS